MEVSCQIEFPSEIQPPIEFRSSSPPCRQHHQFHSHDSDSDEMDDNTTTVFTCARDSAAADGLYHDYSSPYQCIPRESSHTPPRKLSASTSSNRLQRSGDSSEFF